MSGYVVPQHCRKLLYVLMEDPEALKEFNKRMQAVWSEKVKAVTEFLDKPTE